jgi:hypothetical protein
MTIGVPGVQYEEICRMAGPDRPRCVNSRSSRKWPPVGLRPLERAGFHIDLQRDAGHRRRTAPSLRVEGQRHQRRARLDHAQLELLGDAVAEVGGADLRDRQAAAGDDDAVGLDVAAVGLQHKFTPRLRPPARTLVTLHGMRQCTSPAAHSSLSMSMICSAESSQNSWPRAFSW